MNNNLNYATYNYPNLMITGKSIPPQQKSVPSSTNIAFGRGITTITRRKQQQQLNEKQNYLNKNKTIIRRSGSAGQLADNNRRESTISTSAVSVFNTSTQNSRRVVCNCRNGNCKCVPSMAFLEGVYVQNLQTQIEVLELENAYLRGATDRGALFAKQPTTEDNYYNNIQKQRNSSNLFNNHEKRKINKKDEFEDKKEEIILNNLLLKKEKRVGFFNGENEKRKEIIKDWEESFDYSGGDDSDNNNNWKRRNEERKIKEEEEEEKRFLLLERRKEKKEFEEREELVKQEIRIKEAEISRIKGERQELERKLRLAEGKMSDERRSLHTENVELQRRLEGLTPLLAEKETKLIKLEQEIEILNNKLKQQIKEIENLKINLEEKLKENLKQKSEGERIEQRFKLNIETLNNELEESKIREADLERELTETKIKSEQREASYRREEHERYQRVIDELNEQLQQTNERFERSERERNEAEIKIDELRQKNDILEMELELAHDKMSQQQETSRTLEEKQRELHLQEKEHRSAQVRAQRELEALQSLSQSLANENKGLREERADLEERIGELTEMLNIRENRVKRAAELINEFLERYRLTSGRLKQQIGRQAEDCEEFDRLIQKLRQMVNIVSNNPESPTIITNRDGSSLVTNLRPSTTASSSTNSPSLLSASKTTKQRNINKNIGGIKTNINNNRRTKTD